MNVTSNPIKYFGLANGLYYSSPQPYNVPEIVPWLPLDEVQDDCLKIDPVLKDPPAMKGYDPRCRPWYQNTIK